MLNTDTFVIGTSRPGADIQIVIGSTEYIGKANSEGRYNIPVNDPHEGTIVAGRQSMYDKISSDIVTTIVVRAMPAPRPTINEVDTDDTKVTGKGVPNSRVYVKIPGKLERYVSVNGNGDWEIDTGLLEAGKEIIAYQELPDRPNSEEVKRTVVQLPALRNT